MEITIKQQENQIEWGILNAEFLKKNKQAYIWLWETIIIENEQGMRQESKEALRDAKQRLAYWNRSDIEILSEEYLRLQEINAVINSRPEDFKYYTEQLNEE